MNQYVGQKWEERQKQDLVRYNHEENVSDCRSLIWPEASQLSHTLKYFSSIQKNKVVTRDLTEACVIDFICEWPAINPHTLPSCISIVRHDLLTT